MASKHYTGPVCYQDGWHYSTRIDEAGHEVPDERLYLDEDGYRLAEDGDISWHDRTHGQFVAVSFEDGSPEIHVTVEKAEKIRAILEEGDG